MMPEMSSPKPNDCEHGVSFDDYCRLCAFLRTKWFVRDKFSIISQQPLPDREDGHGNKMYNRKKTSYIAAVYSGGEETAKAIAKLPEVVDMLVRVVKVLELLNPLGGTLITNKAKKLLSEMNINHDNYDTWTDPCKEK